MRQKCMEDPFKIPRCNSTSPSFFWTMWQGIEKRPPIGKSLIMAYSTGKRIGLEWVTILNNGLIVVMPFGYYKKYCMDEYFAWADVNDLHFVADNIA